MNTISEKILGLEHNMSKLFLENVLHASINRGQIPLKIWSFRTDQK